MKIKKMKPPTENMDDWTIRNSQWVFPHIKAIHPPCLFETKSYRKLGSTKRACFTGHPWTLLGVSFFRSFWRSEKSVNDLIKPPKLKLYIIPQVEVFKENLCNDHLAWVVLWRIAPSRLPWSKREVCSTFDLIRIVGKTHSNHWLKWWLSDI